MGFPAGFQLLRGMLLHGDGPVTDCAERYPGSFFSQLWPEWAWLLRSRRSFCFCFGVVAHRGSNVAARGGEFPYCRFCNLRVGGRPVLELLGRGFSGGLRGRERPRHTRRGERGGVAYGGAAFFERFPPNKIIGRGHPIAPLRGAVAQTFCRNYRVSVPLLAVVA